MAIGRIAINNLTLLICCVFTLVSNSACAPSLAGARARSDNLVLVAGATGRTGEQVVRQLVDAGYPVRVLARDPAKVAALFGETVEVAVGDVTEPVTLAPAFEGASYAVSAIGSTAKSGPGSPEFIDYGGNNNLVDAAVAANIRQFVLVSSMGVTHEAHPLNKMLGNVLIYQLKNEDYLRASGLAYSIVRPGGLHDKPGGQERIVLEQGDEWKMAAISREDVATICVAALAHPEAINKTFEAFTVTGSPVADWQREFAALAP